MVHLANYVGHEHIINISCGGEWKMGEIRIRKKCGRENIFYVAKVHKFTFITAHWTRQKKLRLDLAVISLVSSLPRSPRRHMSEAAEAGPEAMLLNSNLPSAKLIFISQFSDCFRFKAIDLKINCFSTASRLRVETTLRTHFQFR